MSCSSTRLSAAAGSSRHQAEMPRSRQVPGRTVPITSTHVAQNPYLWFFAQLQRHSTCVVACRRSVEETDESVGRGSASGRGSGRRSGMHFKNERGERAAAAGCRSRGGAAERYPDRARMDRHAGRNGQRRGQSPGGRQSSYAELRRRVLCAQRTVAVRDRPEAAPSRRGSSRGTIGAGQGAAPASAIGIAPGARATDERRGQSAQSAAR